MEMGLAVGERDETGRKSMDWNRHSWMAKNDTRDEANS